LGDMAKKIITLLIVALMIIILLPNVTAFCTSGHKAKLVKPSGSSTPYLTRRWAAVMHDISAYKYNLASYANNDKEMKKCYAFLTKYFKGCGRNIKAYYNKVNSNIRDAKATVPSDLDMNVCSLSKIVEVVKNKKNPSLWCHQQAIFLAAGIKAMFSKYDETNGTYIPDKNIEITLGFYRSYDWLHWPILPYKSHVQLVVIKWPCNINNLCADGKNVYELDTWENQYRYIPKDKLNNIYQYQLNSELKTEEYSFTRNSNNQNNLNNIVNTPSNTVEINFSNTELNNNQQTTLSAPTNN